MKNVIVKSDFLPEICDKEDDFQIKLIDDLITLFNQKSLNEMTGSETRLIYKIFSSMNYFKKINSFIIKNVILNIVSCVKIMDFKKQDVIYNFGNHLFN